MAKKGHSKKHQSQERSLEKQLLAEVDVKTLKEGSRIEPETLEKILETDRYYNAYSLGCLTLKRILEKKLTGRGKGGRSLRIRQIRYAFVVCTHEDAATYFPERSIRVLDYLEREFFKTRAAVHSAELEEMLQARYERNMEFTARVILAKKQQEEQLFGKEAGLVEFEQELEEYEDDDE